MSMNTSTPDTDALDEKLSDFNWDEGYGKLLEHSRKLERERDEAIEKAAAFEQAVQDERNIHMTTIAERDQLRKDLEFLKSKECEAAWCERWKRLCEENTQLRKVCDELSLHLKNHQDFCSGPVDSFDSSGAALHHYNSLPHVIAAKKDNEV